MTKSEPKCLYYGFSFHENEAHCREGYADAESVLAHLDNVGALLEEMLGFAKLTRLEIHGPAGMTRQSLKFSTRMGCERWCSDLFCC